MKKKIIFINVTFLITAIVLIEVISSAILFRIDREKSSLNLSYAISHETIGDYMPNQYALDISTENLPFHVQINDMGFRSLKNFCTKCKKIFFVGDSQTYGLFVNTRDIFSEKTSKKLNDQYVSFNNGIPGSTISSSFDFYKEKISNKKIHNSLIVYTFFPSDIKEYHVNSSINKKSKRNKMSIRAIAIKNDLNLKETKKFLLKNSAFFNILKIIKNSNQNKDEINILRSKRIINEAEINEAEINEAEINEAEINEAELDDKTFEIQVNFFIKKLLEFQHMIEGNNNKLIVQFVPDYTSHNNFEYSNIVDNFVKNKITHYINYFDIYKNYKKEELYLFYNDKLFDDPHIRPLGHEIISLVLSEYIRKEFYKN